MFSHLHGAQIDWGITAAFVGTAITGSLVAGHLGSKSVDTNRLQRWFAYLVLAVAAYVLFDTVFSTDRNAIEIHRKNTRRTPTRDTGRTQGKETP